MSANFREHALFLQLFFLSIKFINIYLIFYKWVPNSYVSKLYKYKFDSTVVLHKKKLKETKTACVIVFLLLLLSLLYYTIALIDNNELD